MPERRCGDVLRSCTPSEWFLQPPVAAVPVQGCQRYIMLVLMVVAVALNIYNLVAAAQKLNAARDRPASTTETDLIDVFPAFSAVVCPFPTSKTENGNSSNEHANDNQYPFSFQLANVTCGFQNALQPCGTPLTLRVRIQLPQPVDITYNCSRVEVPPINRLSFLAYFITYRQVRPSSSASSSFSSSVPSISPLDSWSLKMSANTATTSTSSTSSTSPTTPPESTASQILLNPSLLFVMDPSLALDLGPASTNDIYSTQGRSTSTCVVPPGVAGMLSVSRTEYDRSRVGGSSWVGYTTAFFPVLPSTQTGLDSSSSVLQLASAAGMDFTVRRVVYYYSFDWGDLVASVSGVFSASVAILAFLYPWRPVSGQVRLFRFEKPPEPWGGEMTEPMVVNSFTGTGSFDFKSKDALHGQGASESSE